MQRRSIEMSPWCRPVVLGFGRLMVPGVLAVVTPPALRGQADDQLKGTPLADSKTEMVARSLNLGLVTALTVSVDGTLLIIDRSLPKVLRIRQDGTLAASFGRSGDGPGEFRFPYRLAERSDGSIVVFDLANRSFSEFSSQGAFVKRWTPTPEVAVIESLVALPDRHVAMTGIVRDPTAGNKAVHVFDEQFRLVRSFGELPFARSRAALEQWIAPGMVLTPNGELLVSRRIPYELLWYRFNGTLARKVTLQRRVSRSVDEVMQVTGRDGEQTTRLRKDAAYALWALQLSDGRVISARKQGPVGMWDLLDAKGQLLSSVRAPTRVLSPVDGPGYRGDRGLWFFGISEEREPVLYRVTPDSTRQ